jgi:hypothetical protein
MAKEYKLNKAQTTSAIHNPKHERQVYGRGTGKSNCIAWKMNRIVKSMPRSSSVITGKTFTQILTRTLPPVVSFLERLGYVRNQDFFIGRKPPLKWRWREPYEAPLKYDHYMVIGTPKGSVGFHLASQDREGSSRGMNTDFEFADEFLLINKDRYDKEISATNRANKDRFGHIPFHNGSHFATSMPFSAEGKHILEDANYYEEEAGIPYADIWKRIVRMQLDLLEIEDPTEFRKLWNEISRIKREEFTPFVSKNGLLFTFSNAFDNIENVGLSYIKDQYHKLPRLTFLIEIMNMIIDKVEDCYYNIQEEKQIYYDSYDYTYIDSLDYDLQRLGSEDCRFDKDVKKNDPIKFVVDWGSNISFALAVQENRLVDPNGKLTKNFLKEFYVKPQVGRVMIDDLIDEFCNYYRFHHNKTVIYYKDAFGDEKHANTTQSYNEQAVARFVKNGWNIVYKEYRGKEPPHHEKYLLWSNILQESGSKRFPVVRFNGNNCKNFIVAMKNTRVMEKDNQFKKDKSSEHKRSGVPQEEATHSTDAADKLIWVDHTNQKTGSNDFIATRL